MSGDRPACRLTRWLSVIAGVAALIGVVVGLGGGVHAANSPLRREMSRDVVQSTAEPGSTSRWRIADLPTLGNGQRFGITNIT